MDPDPIPFIQPVVDALANNEYDAEEGTFSFLEQQLEVVWTACRDLEYAKPAMTHVQRALALYAMDEADKELHTVQAVAVAALWSLMFSGGISQHAGLRHNLETYAAQLEDETAGSSFEGLFLEWQPLSPAPTAVAAVKR